MKDHLLSLVRDIRAPASNRSLVAREYLQARILEGLERRGAMVPLAFQGGTALRFLYGIPRYSEDLDFALERSDRPYDFRGWLRALTEMFAAEGYEVELKVSDQRVVHGAFVRFRGLPFDLGLSGQRAEVMAVKVEVDTRPPAGAGLETTVVRRHVLLRLQHHDRSSLLAGKLHAVLARPHAKGRDVYDLFWYLSAPDWPEPNLVLLNHALAQTGWLGPRIEAHNWRSVVGERLQELAWRGVVDDVRPFLESAEAASLLTRENVLGLLTRGMR
jgi:hypothetical protein